MSEFYTSAIPYGKNILYRGRTSDGNPVTRKIEYNPTLFVPTKENTKYKTLDGRPVEPINPGNMKECREFIERYNDVRGFEVFGNINY